MPTPPAVPPPGPATAVPPWWDLPARALAALGLVLTLTALSGALGPHLSGLLAPFPIIVSILAVFCFVLAAVLPGMSTAAAFGLAIAAALTVQGTILLLRSAAGHSRGLDAELD